MLKNISKRTRKILSTTIYLLMISLISETLTYLGLDKFNYKMYCITGILLVILLAAGIARLGIIFINE